MAQKLVAGFPPQYDFPANWIIRLTAVDPTTGAVVSGVNISNVAIVAEPVTPATAPDGGGPSIVPVPIEWANLPIEG